MSRPFSPAAGLVVVQTRLVGPGGTVLARLALDTGATGSMLNWDIAVLLGYDPAASPNRVQVTTGSGVEFAPRIAIESVEALGQARRDFPVLCHTLPPSATVDGLLGLDFLRGNRLVVDFRTGVVELD
ncbi:MAG: retropepsin-like aspartic protease [Planctomycetota bacterium]|nr:retropepsin-like aspartic protease [Planctomycetota bacterium]